MTNERPGALATRKLCGYLRAGRWAPGEQLPSEHELAREIGVGRLTVRAALVQLAAEGLVTSTKRVGWFAQTDQRHEFNFLTVDDTHNIAKSDVWNAWVRGTGRVAANEVVVTRDVPPSDVAALLELEPGEECMVRHRVRLADGEKWMLSTAYWPCWLTDGDPDMSRIGRGPEVDMQNPSPLMWARQRGYPEEHVVHEFDARLPRKEEVEELGIGSSSPVLLTYTTSRGPQGRPFRCTADVFPRHRFRLMAVHRKDDGHHPPEEIAK